jgi:hypothetical protein
LPVPWGKPPYHMTSMRTHRILQGSALFAERPAGYFILRDHNRQPLA